MPGHTGSNKVEYVNLIKNSPSKNMEYIFLGLTFIVSILLIVFAVKPTIDTVLSINKEIKEKKRVVAALDSKINALSKLDGQYLENKEKFEDLTLIFPTAGNFSLMLSNVEAVVSRNGFVLGSVNFSEYDDESYDISASTLMPWTMRLAVSGKKSSFQNLLKDLEGMPMFPVIERVNYSDKVDDDGFTSYSLTLRIYHVENKLFYE
jgi:Tfp pilus assembly protein PilO